MKLSVIIPALDESAELTETVRRARELVGIELGEIIVVDGGSADGTPELARGLGCRVLQAPRGRGRQLAVGAGVASGEVVLFLHADTWLPSNAGTAITTALMNPAVVGGGFWKRFRDPSWLMRGSRCRCWLRLVVAQRLMGDQAIFARRADLVKVGGVPEWPLMEEFELCRRLRSVGRLVLAPATVTTSARRFRRHGVMRTYARMAWITLRYYCGTSVERLDEAYRCIELRKARQPQMADDSARGAQVQKNV
jgi:rSAM/selenodomain-associated transferase 2